LAARLGIETLVKLLLEGEADVELNCRDDRTPLSWAAGGSAAYNHDLFSFSSLKLNKLFDSVSINQ
jgi:hypothetical protein